MDRRRCRFATIDASFAALAKGNSESQNMPGKNTLRTMDFRTRRSIYPKCCVMAKAEGHSMPRSLGIGLTGTRIKNVAAYDGVIVIASISMVLKLFMMPWARLRSFQCHSQGRILPEIGNRFQQKIHVSNIYVIFGLPLLHSCGQAARVRVYRDSTAGIPKTYYDLSDTATPLGPPTANIFVG